MIIGKGGGGAGQVASTSSSTGQWQWSHSVIPSVTLATNFNPFRSSYSSMLVTGSCLATIWTFFKSRGWTQTTYWGSGQSHDATAYIKRSIKASVIALTVWWLGHAIKHLRLSLEEGLEALLLLSMQITEGFVFGFVGYQQGSSWCPCWSNTSVCELQKTDNLASKDIWHKRKIL